MMAVPVAAMVVVARLDVRAAVSESPWTWGVLALAVAIAVTSLVYIVGIVRDLRRQRR